MGFKNNGLPIPVVSNHFSGVKITIERSVYQSLNSNVGNDVGNDTINATQRKIAKRYESIRQLIELNPFITAIQLSEKLSVSDRTIERDLAKMQESGILLREGDRNGGRWIIKK